MCGERDRAEIEVMIETKQTKRGDIIIRISGAALRHNVTAHDDLPEGSRVTHTKTFSDAVLAAMNDEQDDGTTPLHLMLDQVVNEAIEQGADGVKLGGWPLTPVMPKSPA